MHNSLGNRARLRLKKRERERDLLHLPTHWSLLKYLKGHYSVTVDDTWQRRKGRKNSEAVNHMQSEITDSAMKGKSKILTRKNNRVK